LLIENGFEIAAPVEQVWSYLLDVERVAPCMPGAELTEVVDERTWKGKVNVKLGPVSLSFAGTVTMQARDDAARRVVLKAHGMEQKGKGAASATVTSWLEGAGDSTNVKMTADISLSGTIAQLSRGLLPDVSARLTEEFAGCLRASMAASGPAGVPPRGPTPARPPLGGTPPATKPLAGVRLALWALWRWLTRPFRRKPAA
jgi:carbon monoxide dehydrogenase subunit G